MASTALRGLTSSHNSTKAAASRTTAKTRALAGSTAPVTNGRPCVRFMMRSMSRSTYMLMALAPPAARLPPTSVASTSHPDGIPRSATTIVGTVVTSKSSMMRGLVSAR